MLSWLMNRSKRHGTCAAINGFRRPGLWNLETGNSALPDCLLLDAEGQSIPYEKARGTEYSSGLVQMTRPTCGRLEVDITPSPLCTWLRNQYRRMIGQLHKWQVWVAGISARRRPLEVGPCRIEPPAIDSMLHSVLRSPFRHLFSKIADCSWMSSGPDPPSLASSMSLALARPRPTTSYLQ